MAQLSLRPGSRREREPTRRGGRARFLERPLYLPTPLPTFSSRRWAVSAVRLLPGLSMVILIGGASYIDVWVGMA